MFRFVSRDSHENQVRRWSIRLKIVLEFVSGDGLSDIADEKLLRFRSARLWSNHILKSRFLGFYKSCLTLSFAKLGGNVSLKIVLA